MAHKDKMIPVSYGVGFIGYGVHKTTYKRKITRCYSAWIHMFERCYCPKRLARRPKYKGCTVCPEWHNFQVFAEWFYKNYIDGYELDKDIKINGNKIYSPEACMFVTTADNSEKANAKEYAFLSPKGELVNIYNLSKFCRNNNLNTLSMYAVYGERQTKHKGWTRQNK